MKKYSKKFGSKKIFGQKIICPKKFGEEIDGQKKIWQKKYFLNLVKKNFGSKKFWGQKPF